MNAIMSSLAKNSCTRCRSQKLRCSRHLPICERCKHLQAHCVYVEIKRQRRSRKNIVLQLTRKEDTAAQNNNHQGAPYFTSSSMLPFSARNDTVLSPSASSDARTSSPPPSVTHLLDDIYFEYAISTCWTIHRPTFEADKKIGQIPAHLLLSIRAVATIFLQPSRLSQLHQDKIFGSENTQNLGLKWAREAGALVLRGIDDPSLEQIQTCQNLGIYWFANGDFKRNSMFTGICYRAARTAMLDPSRDDDNLRTQTKLETRRRCFWAAYMSACLNGDHYILGSSKDVLIKEIPLPVSEASFYHAVREPLVTINDSLNSNNAMTFDGEPSVFAEVQKLVLRWAQIRDYLEARKTQTSRDMLLDFFTLEDDLEAYQKYLHPLLVYSRDNVLIQHTKGRAPSVFMLESMYQHCRLILHGSLVPYFGGRPPQDSTASSVVRNSARITLEAAQTLSTIAGDILSLDLDQAYIAPLSGHSFYVAATIHATFLSRSDELGLKACKNLVPLLEVLTLMSPHWKSLERSTLHLVTVLQAVICRNTQGLAVPKERSIEQLAATSPEHIRASVGHLSDRVLYHSLGQGPHRKENTSQNSLNQDLLTLQAYIKSFIDQNENFDRPQHTVTESNMTDNNTLTRSLAEANSFKNDNNSLTAQQSAPSSELGWEELAWHPNMLIPNDFRSGNIFSSDYMGSLA